MGLGGFPAASKRSSFERPSALRPSISLDRPDKTRAVNESCPLEIGHDPRRESIGGEAAPAHLRGLPPLRVLPEVSSISCQTPQNSACKAKAESTCAPAPTQAEDQSSMSRWLILELCLTWSLQNHGLSRIIVLDPRCTHKPGGARCKFKGWHLWVVCMSASLTGSEKNL